MIKEESMGKWLATFQKKKTYTLYRSGARHFLSSIYGGEADRTFEEYEQLSIKFILECKAERDWFEGLA